MTASLRMAGGLFPSALDALRRPPFFFLPREIWSFSCFANSDEATSQSLCFSFDPCCLVPQAAAFISTPSRFIARAMVLRETAKRPALTCSSLTICAVASVLNLGTIPIMRSSAGVLHSIFRAAVRLHRRLRLASGLA